jgi:hypothetical protein
VKAKLAADEAAQKRTEAMVYTEMQTRANAEAMAARAALLANALAMSCGSSAHKSPRPSVHAQAVSRLSRDKSSEIGESCASVSSSIDLNISTTRSSESV